VRVVKKGSQGGVASKLARGVLALALAFSTTGALNLATSTATAIKAYADEATDEATVAAAQSDQETVSIPLVTGLTYQEASTKLTQLKQQGKINWHIADGNSTASSAKVTGQVVEGVDGWVYDGMEVPKGSTIIIYTNDSVPVITDMQIGYYTGRILAYSDGTTKEEVHWVDPNNPSTEDVAAITQRAGTTRLTLRVKWSTTGSYATWTDTDGVAKSDILWSSSNRNAALVDEHGDGTVTACGTIDGTITITAKLTNSTYIPASKAEEGVSASIDINLLAQTGAYPEEVTIVDEFCNALGDQGTYLESDDATAEFQPYVRVSYVDGSNVTVKCNAPLCQDGSHDHVTDTTSFGNLTWSIGASSSTQSIIYINSTTGTVTPYSGVAGKVQIVATVLGGVDGKVSGYTWVTVKGDLSSKPATSLKVNVVYEDYSDLVVNTKTYSLDSFASVSSTGAYKEYSYTQVKQGKNGDYRTVSGVGVTLTDLFADMGVTDTSEIRDILCDSTTGQTNLHVSPIILFDKTNYYFPYYNQVDSRGIHNTTAGVAVEPMFAVKSYAVDDDVTTSFEDSDLGTDYSFELLLGNNGYSDGSNGDYTAHFSYYRVYAVTIVLKGSPPYDLGNGSGGSGSGGGGVGGTGAEGSGGDTGEGGDEGQGTSTGKNIVEGIGEASTSTELNNASVDAGGAVSADSSNDLADGEVEQTESSKRWQVFEMMSSSEDNFDIEYINPYEKYLVPAMCTILLLGGLFAFSKMRSEEEKLKIPKWLASLLGSSLKKDQRAQLKGEGGKA
jgi:hypothetical protein